MKNLGIVAALILVIVLVGFGFNKSPKTEITGDFKGMTQIVMTTSAGDITLEMYDEQAPNTVANFVKLAKEGFYDGTRFHRIIEGFMIQGGDPQSKDLELSDMWGTGGPGYKFEDEIYAGNNNKIGTIAMANAGPNTNGSQFFINVGDNTFLNPKHTVFGYVVEGYDIVEELSHVATQGADRPVEDVVLEKVTVIESAAAEGEGEAVIE